MQAKVITDASSNAVPQPPPPPQSFSIFCSPLPPARIIVTALPCGQATNSLNKNNRVQWTKRERARVANSSVAQSMDNFVSLVYILPSPFQIMIANLILSIVSINKAISRKIAKSAKKKTPTFSCPTLHSMGMSWKLSTRDLILNRCIFY
jgi:hypothetical protein